jgi:hypothetical protein
VIKGLFLLQINRVDDEIENTGIAEQKKLQPTKRFIVK